MVECCPICGKKPRLKIKVYGDQWGTEVFCKPFLKKAHLSTFAADENEIDSVLRAIKMWNFMVIRKGKNKDGH